ncbi:TniB family NTP-binding protein [Deferribacteres bacterium DY0037]
MSTTRRLHPDVAKILSNSPEERIKFAKKERFIKYPLADQILRTLEDLMEAEKCYRMQSILLCGDSNNGKTSIVRKFVDLHPIDDGVVEIEAPLAGTDFIAKQYVDTGEPAKVPVIYVNAPEKADVNHLLENILFAIDVPYRKTDSVSRKEKEIIYFCQNYYVKVLIIDEIHNVLSGSSSKQREFMNAIKNMSNYLQIPIVLVGTKDAFNAVNTDMQILSRFEPIWLPRWKLDGNLMGLLNAIEYTLPLKHESAITQNEQLVNKILDLSEGVLGNIVQIVKRLAVAAITNGTEKITVGTLKHIKYVKESERYKFTIFE